MSESPRQINTNLNFSAAYNKPVQGGDPESATELRTKLNAVRQQPQEESDIPSLGAGYVP